jgi:hypothetical protein
MSIPGKESFLADLATIGRSDGPLTTAERHILDIAGEALGLTATHVLGIAAASEMARTPITDDDPSELPPPS